MSTDNPSIGDEKPPILKKDGGNDNPARHNQRRDNKRNNHYPKPERFTGSHPDLIGYVFTVSTSRTAQIHQFTKTDERIRALVGQKYDPHVLQSIETGAFSCPTEPNLVVEADGSVKKEEEVKYRTKYSKWCDLKYLIESQLKNVYSIYYGQCDKDMKATLEENSNFKTVDQSKDTLALYKLLQNANFSYTPSQEPILTMWLAKYDFVRLRQQKGQSVTEYRERFSGMLEVNEN